MTFRMVSWNVNGIRAIIKKGFCESVRTMAPDMLCLQETKAGEEDALEALQDALPEYKSYVNSSKARKGYSGTAILSKVDPVAVTYDIGEELHDQEGRVITAEFTSFFLLTVYTPNSGQALARLDYREQWDRSFLSYVQWLHRRKPVVVCGDLNVAHHEIDIARAKENYNKSAGYTQREIDGFNRLRTSAGLVDTFRRLHPQQVAYSYWNYINNGREKNVGWRIDYFLITEELLPRLKMAAIYSEHYGSDHCPVVLEL